ncbi:HD-GYP domain-containing protein [Pseudomonas oryzae]|uniref:Metal dependent phosphohydrolase n=1 Tax=Pseudomonas oryzae TaxID=1392877 RepID=A0A1H1XVW1_9PSED|nr:HD domain-containing phosphohydrolase [Pseudomonas oryzae]SDT13019.1 metal dependent phosphohydrolase [Pseudomonas oryzae]
MNSPVRKLVENSETLTTRLATLHSRLLASVPCVDRIACALYDAGEDTLRTFINSTRSGHTISGYEYRLSASRSLQELAQTGDFRVLDELSTILDSNTAHSQWLREQGYHSSFTVPIYDANGLLGFVFFDALQPAAFTAPVQRDLALYSSLIGMSISNEISAVKMTIESARVASQLTKFRDFETGAHLERMARFSRLIAQEVAPRYGLDDEFVENVYLFAPLHDIGKIGIPDRVLQKPGKLDDSERAIMETHVQKGMEIIERMMGKNGLNALPDSRLLRNIVLCHHEMLDGSGYPRGLRGEQIALEARIVAVADIFDALTAKRPYKPEWPVEDAFGELRSLVEQGKLDRTCVQALLARTEDVRAIMAKYVDTES